jgi:hypothetical protein
MFCVSDLRLQGALGKEELTMDLTFQSELGQEES